MLVRNWQLTRKILRLKLRVFCHAEDSSFLSITEKLNSCCSIMIYYPSLYYFYEHGMTDFVIYLFFHSIIHGKMIHLTFNFALVMERVKEGNTKKRCRSVILFSLFILYCFSDLLSEHRLL